MTDVTARLSVQSLEHSSSRKRAVALNVWPSECDVPDCILVLSYVIVNKYQTVKVREV